MANIDPHDLDARLLKQCSEILEHLELIDIGHQTKLPFKERIAAMTAIAGIRKEFRRSKGEDDESGSSIRKYTKSFAHAGRRQRGDTGRADADDGRTDGEDIAAAESATR